MIRDTFMFIVLYLAYMTVGIFVFGLIALLVETLIGA